MSRFSSNIIGINKTAPAGGKFIFILLNAANKTIHESAVHKDNGSIK